MRRRAACLLALLTVALLPSAASAQAVLMPTERGLPPLAVKYQRVTIDVLDGAAVTKVEQVFVNSTGRPLEATYLFPVPSDAVMTDFKLKIGDKMERGELMPKRDAERIYTEIVRRVKDPGILDWMREGLFRARVFPVPPRGEQKFELTYTQVLPFEDGTYKLTYPLKSPATAVTTLEDFTLTTNITHTKPIKGIYSPTHKVAVARKGEYRAIVGFEGNQVTLDSDFVLYFGVDKKDLGLSVITHRPNPNEPGYYLLMAAPKAVYEADEIQGKAITFVLDTSGSMHGPKMTHAKKALEYCLSQLGSDDLFNVIRFSSDVESLVPSGMLSASRANIDKGKAFVEGFEAAGGTAIDEALRTALAADVRGTQHLVVFITDGRPTIGETEMAKILSNAKDRNRSGARVFPFGIGDDIHTHLLDKLAEQHGGTSQYVKPNEAIEVHVASFYNKIAYPVLSDVRIAMDSARVYANQPGILPDLFRGGQILVVGRYRNPGDHLIRVTGTMGERQMRFDYEHMFPRERQENEFVAKLWAHRQVGYLLDQVRLSGETPEIKQEIVQLATRYGIVTPYTSYLVVEPGALNDPRPRPMPRPHPHPHRRRLFRSSGGGFGGSAQNAPAAPEAEESPGDELVKTAKKKGEFKADTGKAAVRSSKAVRHLREKDVARNDVESVRHVGGRVFAYRGGRWVDTAMKGRMKTLEIAPYSDAWMAVAKLSKDLKAALALGEEVVVVVGKTALVVKKGGKDKLTGSELKSLK